MTVKKTNIRYLAMVCIVASLGGLLFGFDTAVISGTIGMVETLFGLSKLELGWFTSSALVGCIFGALVAGGLSDKYGRRPVLIVAAVLFFLSALGCTISPSFTILVSVRIVGGIGVGIASVTSPLYISEFSPPKIRGRLVALYQLSIVTGINAVIYYGPEIFRTSRDSIWKCITIPGNSWYNKSGFYSIGLIADR